MIVHGGLIAAWIRGHWRGALILGPSGAGKSDLALRALDQGFRLVADDRVLLWPCEGRVYGRAPDTLKGMTEIRGLGIGREPALGFCEISLIMRCEAPERLPDPRSDDYFGLKIPSIALLPLESSAPAKLRRALQHLGCNAEGAYLDALAVDVSPRPGGDSR